MGSLDERLTGSDGDLDGGGDARAAGAPEGGSPGTDTAGGPTFRIAHAVVVGVVLLAAIGAATYFTLDADRSGAEHAADRELSPDPTSTSAPPPPELEVPQPILPLEEMPWPVVPPASREAFARAVNQLTEGVSLYPPPPGSPGVPAAREWAEYQAPADALVVAALNELDRLDALVPELGDYHLRTLELLLQRSQLDRAQQRVEWWLERFPNDASHHLARGKILFQNHRWAEAAAALQRAAALRPGSLESRHWLAESCFHAGMRAEGTQALDEGLALLRFPSPDAWSKPLAEEFLGNAIKVLHRFRDFERLQPVAHYYRERRPDVLEVVMAEGIALAKLGRYEEAIPLLERARGGRANREEVQFELGLAHKSLEHWQQAGRTFAGLLADDPFFSRAYYHLGLVFARLERRADAEVLFARSRALGTSERELRRGFELHGVGQMGKAAATRAYGFQLRQEYDRAESVLRARGLEREPHAVLALAGLYRELWRIPEARRVLAHAATLVGASHPDVRSGRALCLVSEGKTAEGLRELARVVAEHPAAEVWRLELARVQIETGRADAAVGTLQPVGESGGLASFELARALLLGGRPVDALTAIRRTSQGDKRWGAWRADLWLAWALAAGGDGEADARRAAELVGAAEIEDRASEVFLRARAAVWDVTSPPPPALARQNADALVAWTEAETRIRALRARIARGRWPGTAALYVELARLHAERGERLEAVRIGLIARFAAPRNPAVLRALAGWLTSPGDVYLRLRVLRELAKRLPDETAIAREIVELEERWVKI